MLKKLYRLVFENEIVNSEHEALYELLEKRHNLKSICGVHQIVITVTSDPTKLPSWISGLTPS